MNDLKKAAIAALEILDALDANWAEPEADALRAALAAEDDGMAGAKALAKAYEQGWNAALAQPQSEPVAWRVWRGDAYELFFNHDAAIRRGECFSPIRSAEPLYLAPPTQSTPLTEIEMNKLTV